MSYTATASIIYELFMYYTTYGKNWEFIEFNKNVAKLFIDHQQSPTFDFDNAFLCATQNPKLYDETYLLDRHLKQFYLEMEWWITGKDCKYAFNPATGLCMNLRYYGLVNKLSESQLELLWDKLEDQFAAAGLHKSYPFEDGSRQKYEDELRKYQNKQRIDWIKQHAV